jgi:HD superfamily phosphohydrolase
MDYLGRDSLHAGVPYGRNFDQNRLIGSLTVNESGTGLAITAKGKTAAEMMVFARYVMFSEVYWHHSVRAATAMVQRAFYLLHDELDLDELFRLDEHALVAKMRKTAGKGPADELLAGLFGSSRRLYKRWAEFSYFQNNDIYQQIARQPYAWLAACAEQLASLCSSALGRVIAPHEILIDAPPIGLEVQFDIDVYYAKEDTYRTLAEVSPVVRSLAERQFDDYVKRVRIFAHPSIVDDLRSLDQLESLLSEAISRTDG